MELTGAEVSLIMTYLRNCELAQGSVAAVCRSWFQIHRGCAWASMVLSAGAADDLMEDLALSEAHTTVERFLSAPRQMQEHASRVAQSFILKICQLEEFLDHYEKWITLPFDRLKRCNPSLPLLLRAVPAELNCLLLPLAVRVELKILLLHVAALNSLLLHLT